MALNNESYHKFLPYIIAALLVLAVIVGYHNTLRSPFVLDDESNIVRNNYIRIQDLGAASWQKIFSEFSTSSSRKIANLSFALNYLVGEYDPTGYHLVNIFIHIITSLVIFRLFVWYLVKSNTGVRGAEITLAGLAALLWAVNPIQTNAVTYIVQRMTSLCALFFLASLLVYLLARDLPAGKTGGAGFAKKIGLFLAAFLLWVLAMLTKEIAAIMPALLLLHEIFFFDRLDPERIAGKKYYYLAALVIPLIAVGIYLGSGVWQSLMNSYAERDFTMTERLLTQPRAVLRYMSIFLLPLPSRMTMFYDYQISRSLFDPLSTVFSILTITVLAAGSCLLAKKYTLIAFGILWTLLCLLIESSVLPLELIFEHRFYLPSVGFSLAVAVALSSAFNRFSVKKEVAGLCGVCLVLALVAMTALRNHDWRSLSSIYLDGTRKAPRSLRAISGLGGAYMREGKYDQAKETLEQALAMEPHNIVSLVNLFIIYSDFFLQQQAEPYLAMIKRTISEGYFHCREAGNIGLMAEVLVRQKRYQDVIFLLEGLLARCSSLPTPVFYDNLALCYARTDNHDKAVENFGKALARDPKNPYTLLSLARSYLLLGDKENAALTMHKLRGVPIPEDLRPHVEKITHYLAEQ